MFEISNLANKLMSNLEDPKYPSVSPHLNLLSFLGIWDPNKPPKLRYNKIHFYLTVLFYITIYIKAIFFQVNLDSFLTIIKYVPFHVGMLKVITFKKDHSLWEDLINYMSSVERDQLAKKDEKFTDIIKTYIAKNRRVTYLFWGYVYCANFLIFTEPFLKNQKVENGTDVYFHMFDGYTPFGREPPGYFFAMIIEVIMGFTVSAYIIAWDALVVSIMIFFAGQLKIAKVMCANIIEDDAANSHRNIIKLHKYYTKLVRYQIMLNDIISTVMFIYLIFASVNLGVCTIQIVGINDDLLAVVWSCAYVVAIFLQLLLFYWHSNEVTVESLEVKYGIFNGDWTMADKRLKRELLLLGYTTNKRLVFWAGPFTEMSLYVFTAILRGTYSFYTLLNGTN